MFCLLKISHFVDTPVWHGALDMHTKLQRVWTTTEHRRWWQRQWWIWHIKNYISSKGMTGSEIISRTTSGNKAFLSRGWPWTRMLLQPRGTSICVYECQVSRLTGTVCMGSRPRAWEQVIPEDGGREASQHPATLPHGARQGKRLRRENCLLSHIYLFSPEMCSDCRATPIEGFSYDAISCLRTRYSCSTFSNVCSSFVSSPGGGLLNYTESSD